MSSRLKLLAVLVFFVQRAVLRVCHLPPFYSGSGRHVDACWP